MFFPVFLTPDRKKIYCISLGCLPFPIVIFILMGLTCGITAGTDDFYIDGTLPIANDIPHIQALLRRTPDGPPLETDEYGFVPIDAYLDTGASGILLSRDTRDLLGVAKEPGAIFVDAGVGGDQYFEVSESLYINVADFEVSDPMNPALYTNHYGPWRTQLTIEDDLLIGPLDIFGVPVMGGKIVVLDPSYLDLDTFDFKGFTAALRKPGAPDIPPVDFEVLLRYTDFLYFSHPDNIPPFPVMGYNPIIEDITISYNNQVSTGNWLFDTGAQSSFISTEQAYRLGLVDADGEPIVPPDFTLPVGGIGGSTEAPGYRIDSLSMDTLQGFKLIYGHPSLLVGDIGIIDEQTGEPIILDGVFGSNFLDMSLTLEFDIVDSPYSHIVIDTVRGVLGFDLKDIFTPPAHCGDPNHPYPPGDINRDCSVNQADAAILAEFWLASGCDPNYACHQADLNGDENVNLLDLVLLQQNWQQSSWPPQCGDPGYPWLPGDLNRDCRIEQTDVLSMLDEWLSNDCDLLNWNCAGCDLNKDGTVNLVDFAILTQEWLTCTHPAGC